MICSRWRSWLPACRSESTSSARQRTRRTRRQRRVPATVSCGPHKSTPLLSQGHQVLFCCLPLTGCTTAAPSTVAGTPCLEALGSRDTCTRDCCCRLAGQQATAGHAGATNMWLRGYGWDSLLRLRHLSPSSTQRSRTCGDGPGVQALDGAGAETESGRDAVAGNASAADTSKRKLLRQSSQLEELVYGLEFMSLP